MALKKKSKGTAKKTIAKKAPVKKQAKTSVPVKKATAKKPVAKKANPTKAKPSPKVAKTAKKITPSKKTNKPISKKSAVKKSGVKKSASKKSPVPNKIGKASLEKKPMALAKRNQKKEETRKTPPKATQNKSLPKAKDIKVPAPPPVVLPKISTTKARKYEPEFTKSVLDQAPPENNGPTQRYSDAELNEFKELILRKLETAKKELAYLQGLITRKDEMGGDETDNRYMTMEDGSLSMEREQLSQMASRQITFIDHLEKAMMRIENKTYGICRVTGKLIDKARLRAVPHATLSIEAKMGIVK